MDSVSRIENRTLFIRSKMRICVQLGKMIMMETFDTTTTNPVRLLSANYKYDKRGIILLYVCDT